MCVDEDLTLSVRLSVPVSRMASNISALDLAVSRLEPLNAKLVCRDVGVVLQKWGWGVGSWDLGLRVYGNIPGDFLWPLNFLKYSETECALAAFENIILVGRAEAMSRVQKFNSGRVAV